MNSHPESSHSQSLLPSLLCLCLGVVLSGCGDKTGELTSVDATQPQIESSPAASKPVATVQITKEKPFVNGLGMKFAPLADTGDQLSIWETRVQDFTAYLKATGQPVGSNSTDMNLHPVAGVSWNDAVSFCAWLTEKEQREGRIGPNDRYRLPKDKEWSLATGKTRYPWGDNWPKTQEHLQLPGYKPSTGDHTAPVGSYSANALGIHDLAGNVFEWCQDWYSMDMNPPELRLEFERLTFDGGGTKYKVLRGASWVFFDSLNLVSDYRYFNLPSSRGILYGFRCLLDRNALGQGQPPPKNLPLWKLPAADARSIAGRETYRGNCVECHQYYDPTLYPEGDWANWLGRMKGKAKLNDKAFAEVVQFTGQLRDNAASASGKMVAK